MKLTAIESIEGTESIDQEIFDGIAKLLDAVEGKEPEKPKRRRII